MIPLKCLVARSRVAAVTGVLVLMNVLVFLFELSLGRHLEAFVRVFGLRPIALLSGAAHLDPSALVPVFTSMFIHGGWLHLAGNMLFLWVFGSVVEDRIGHVRYGVLYAASGIAAALAQLIATPFSRIPEIGASGAIAGVLGAYLVLLPWSRVRSFVPIFFLFVLWDVPAPVFLLVWFVMQLLSGFASIDTGQAMGGVAYWAHVGGFIAGAALLVMLRETLPRRSASTWQRAQYG